MATNSGGIGGGSKYQGFGSEDLKKYSGGYDVQGINKPSGGYDPYKRKGGSAFDTVTKSKQIVEKKKKETPKKKSKKSKTKKKSESEDSDDSSDDDSGSEDSSEEEKPKPKKESKKGLSNPARKQSGNNKTNNPKVVKEPEVKKPDLFDLFDTNDSKPAQTSDNMGLADLGIDFGQPTQNKQPAFNNMNMFENMNVGAGNNQPNNMFSNMAVNNPNTTQPTTFSPTPASGSAWDPFGSNSQPVNSVPSQSTNNVTDMFGNMSMNQSSNHAPATGGGFNMFEGMSQTPLNPVANSNQPKNLVDDFGDFQDSNPPQAVNTPAPKKDDAWEMGGGLFNLSGLKKDSEKKDKLTHHVYGKPAPEANMLYTKADDLNSGNIWGSAFGGSTAQHTAPTNFGYASSTFPASNQPSGYTNNQFPTSQPFGANQYSTGFGGNNMQSNSGFPSTGFPASGGFPNAQSQPQSNQWPSQGYNTNTGGFPSGTQNASPFY